jgi:dynein heavy chain
MIDKVRDEAKKKGINETPTDLYNYFLEKVKDNLHIILAMSPAGDTLRIRCRNFPGLISSTSIDWFFTWPEEALVSVANYLLEVKFFNNNYLHYFLESIINNYLTIKIIIYNF